MEQMSGQDATNLYLETPSSHQHTMMVAIFDPSGFERGLDFTQMRNQLAERLGRIPAFRKRLYQVPFQLAHPYWVDDPGFDIDFHLRHAALPSPGGMDELAAFIGDIGGQPLDRSKPLWQFYVIEGLTNGHVALAGKVHNSVVNAVAGAEVLTEILDLESHPTSAPKRAPYEPDYSRAPDVVLTAKALLGRLAISLGVTKLAYNTGRAVMDVRRLRNKPESTSGALPLTTPRTSFNSSVTPRRKVVLSSISLDDVNRLNNLLDCTVNDIILAVCTGALRSYLVAGGELPKEPLVVTTPSTVGGDSSNADSRASAMSVGLPCALKDPLARMEFIKSGAAAAKHEQKVLGPDVLLEWVQLATPNLFNSATKACAKFRLAERLRPIHTTTISNLAAPDFPLYLQGTEMVAVFPISPLPNGSAISISVTGYGGGLFWGIVVCPESVPRADDFSRYIPEALDELLVAAGLDPVTPVGVARKGGGDAASGRATSGTAGRPRAAQAKKTAKSSARAKRAVAVPNRTLSEPRPTPAATSPRRRNRGSTLIPGERL